MVELDRACLRGDEFEPLQQTRRQARMPSHRGPLEAVEASALAQDGGVDRHLAQVVKAAGPAQAVDVGERQPQSSRERVDIARDAQRMAIRGRVALVDDVGERLQCA